jgi:hypothetical protein
MNRKIMQYIPDTTLLNNIFLPFYVSPVKTIYNISKDSLETGNNGIKSVINIETLFPYVHIQSFDYETKDWFWYDSDGFPFRIEKNMSLNCWQLRSIYNIGTYKDVILKIDPFNLSYDSSGKGLGFYTVVIGLIDNYNVIEPSLEIKMYSGQQIFVEIDGNILTDRTDYLNSMSDVKLTLLNTASNMEFYYNFLLNKIYTNQNLESYNLSDIKVYMYNTIQEISVKTSLLSNYGFNNVLTPVVDYYIVKLHGQLIR